MKHNKSTSSVACIRFVWIWHRAWALYHKLELHAAFRRGDMSDVMTHAGKELYHSSKTPLIRKPNVQTDPLHGRGETQTEKQDAES
jgi:hypothetical protein